jgi:hypothetical protein
MMTLKAALLIAAVFIFTFGLLYLTHRKRKARQGVLSIDSGNKDRDISLSEYHDEIDAFLNQMRYVKDDERYSPRPIQQVFGGDISKKSDSYSIQLEGPYHMIKILEGILSTPGSKFKTAKK